MNPIARRYLITAALAFVSSGHVLADSGDNGMSPLTGDSYAAFHGSNLGAYPRVDSVSPASDASGTDEDSVRDFDVIIGLPREDAEPLRDDTTG